MSQFLTSDVDRSEQLKKGSLKYGSSKAVLENSGDPAKTKAAIELYKTQKATHESELALFQKALKEAEASGEEGSVREAVGRIKEVESKIKQAIASIADHEQQLKNDDSANLGFQQTEKTTTADRSKENAVVCPLCDGKNSEHCWKCDGAGVIENSTADGLADDPDAGQISNSVCPDCEGSGKDPNVPSARCSGCKGTGEIQNDGDPKADAAQIERHVEGIQHEVDEIKANAKPGDKKFFPYDPGDEDAGSLRRSHVGDDIADSEGLWLVKAVKKDGLDCEFMRKNSAPLPDYKSFIFVDDLGETEKVEAKSEAEAWDLLAKNLGMELGDIKRTSVKLQKIAEVGTDAQPGTAVMNHAGDPGPIIPPGDLGSNSKAQEPCPSCGLPKQMKPAGGDENSFVCGNRQCKEFKNELPDGTFTDPEDKEKRNDTHPTVMLMKDGISLGVLKYGSKENAAYVCDECGKPIPKGTGRIGFDGGKSFHDKCYDKLHP